jgi:hypothetical protein
VDGLKVRRDPAVDYDSLAHERRLSRDRDSVSIFSPNHLV